MVQEIQSDEDTELSTRLQKIVNKSLDAVVDRLENGEYVYNNRTGNITRVPANLKDVHRVAVDLHDKRTLLRNRQVAKRDEGSEGDRLLKLAEQFASFANAVAKSKKDPDHDEKIIDGEVIQ
jgi:hypothetical protein